MNCKKLRNRKKGFTLVELLVVIAIIALLLSILMPALQKVRKSAYVVICQSNVKQFAYATQMYTQENQSKFWIGPILCNPNGSVMSVATADPPNWPITESYWWGNALLPYYKDKNLRLCPAAKKRKTAGAQDPFAAWENISAANTRWPINEPTSYGENAWIAYRQIPTNAISYDLTKSGSIYWKKTTLLQSPNKVPILFDYISLLGDNGGNFVGPYPTDTPPEHATGNLTTRNDMSRLLHTRHDGQINMTLGDSSVRKVSIKELWHLNWYVKWRQRVAPMYNPDNTVLDPVWSQYPWIQKLSGQGSW